MNFLRCVILNSFYDVQQLLKKFGVIIYVGDRLGDIELMELEIRELHKSQLIDNDLFKKAILVLRHEMQKCKNV